MTYVFAQPQTIATAVADVSGIGSTIGAANASAAGWTIGLQAAAADEVSAATANLFSAYAQEYQELIRQGQAFHDEFARALANAANAYAATESTAASALATPGSSARAQFAPLSGGAAAGTTSANAAPTKVALSLVLGASGIPTPNAKYIATAYANYISRNFTAPNLEALSTPQGLYPITGVKDLTLNISVDRGLTILNNALIGPNGQITLGHTPVNVFGYSQGAMLAALELPKLQAAGVPTDAVNFVLVGNEMTPNGGMLARFPGLDIPSLGLPFYGGMPSNTGYTIYDYTLEYDGFADFPRYPIDVFADLNAFAGIAFVHTSYLNIPPSQIDSAITLPTSPGYDGGTTYYMIPTQNLPLLDPVRAIPYLGNPLADLLQPDLRYLVNWGYGDPNYGYSTGYADVTTPFGVVPPLNETLALGPDLVSGTHQGIIAAAGDLSAQGLPPVSVPALPDLSHVLSTPPALPTGVTLTSALDGAISGLENANTAFANSLASNASTAYATLLPTADIATALVTTLPSYDLNLFLNGISQAINGQPVQGLINAIGQPIAADVGLGTLAGGVEFLVIASALDTILTGAPHPSP